MGLDIQIQEQALLSIVANTVQETLASTCADPFPPFYFDHADVSTANPPTITYGDNFANIHISVDFFVVSETSLEAHVNGTPPEASAPIGQANITLELRINGTSLVVRITDIYLDPRFDAIAQPIRDRLQQSIGDIEGDLTPVFAQLGIDTPQTDTLEQMGSTLLLRFDPNSDRAARDRLPPGQAWCLFVDDATMLTLTSKKLAGVYRTFKANGIGATVPYEGWVPKGNVPHIEVKIPFVIPVAGGYGITATLYLAIDFSFASSILPLRDGSATIQQLVNWDVRDVNANSLPISIPVPLDVFVRQKVIAMFDPAALGGIPVGQTEFMLQQHLQSISLRSAIFVYKSLTADQDGMLISGPINVTSSPLTSHLDILVEPFPKRFTKYIWCRRKSSPSPSTLSGYSVTASIHLQSEGELCKTEIIAPDPTRYDIGPFLSSSGSTITITLSPSVSSIVNSIADPVVLRIRTSRGVRIVNVDLPPAAELNARGEPTDSDLRIMNDCFGPIFVDPWVLHFGSVFNPKWHVDPPPVWVDNVAKVAAFQSSLIILTAVVPGEVINLQQPMDGGISSVSASGKGSRVTIPALFAVRSIDEGAFLQNINRNPLGPVTVSSRLFQRVAVLRKPGALSHRLVGKAAQGAKVITSFRDRDEITTVDGLGILSSFQISGIQEEEKSANNLEDQWESPVAVGNAHSLRTKKVFKEQLFNIPGLTVVHSIPGFEGTDFAIAELSDGTYRALYNDGTDSGAKVIGTVPRWPKTPLSVCGGWAISSTIGEEIAIFSVEELAAKFQVNEESCCAKCTSTYAWGDALSRFS